VSDLEVQKDFLKDVNGKIRKSKIKAGLVGFSIGAAVVTICIIPPVVLYLMKK
jgi:hypothetical protein